MTEWVDTVHGRLKTRVYATETVGDSPILLIVLHGDIPNPPPTYHYFAQAVAEGYDAVAAMPGPVRARLGESLPYADIVAASILRPGYTDEEGDRSDGDMGYAVTDNFTPEVVDAVAEVIAHLQAEYRARAVILAGHSGGAAISANVLGRHPELADGALLVACGCDPDAFYARRRLTDPDPFWNQPNPSLRPLVLAADVPNATRVRVRDALRAPRRDGRSKGAISRDWGSLPSHVRDGLRGSGTGLPSTIACIPAESTN